MREALIFAGPVFFVAYVQGFLNPFWLLGAAPLLFAAVLLREARNSRRSQLPIVAFAVPSTALVLFVHCAWLFDWGETATGSSTSALIFIFLPFYAFFLGGLGCLAGWGIGRLRN